MRLEVQALETGYGKAQVLFGVDLEVEAGELVALLGANGAGKTTLLRALSGLLRPWKGSVLLGGKDLRGLSPARRARLGLGHVPEGRQLFPLFPQLAERRRQLAGTLSGGEQQMLAIGRALMGFPRILLVDEPSLGLSPRLAEEVLLALKEVARGGVGVLLVEQNVALSLEVAERGYVLEHGRVVLEGPAQALAQDPRVREAYLSL